MKHFNICIIRPVGYVFSSAFLELAELLAYSLEDNGFSVQISENRLHPHIQNLLIGCHLLDASLTSQIPRRTIILNTEQIGSGPKDWDIGSGPKDWDDRVFHFLKAFPSWDYSKENIEKLQVAGIGSTRHLQIGYHRKLNRIPSMANKDIDALFYGVLTEERLATLARLEAEGARVCMLSDVWGQDRDAYIARAKVVLNLHQRQEKIFEIVRVHYLMNNKKVIISQFDADTKIDPVYKDGLILAGGNDIVETSLATIASEDLLKLQEQKALDTIMRIDSAKIVHDLIYS